MSALSHDLRYAWRHYARRPVVTITIVVVLALGMAVTAGLFSFIRAYGVEPAPGIVKDESVVRIRGRLEMFGNDPDSGFVRYRIGLRA